MADEDPVVVGERPPTEDELLQPFFAAGVDADHPYAVLYQGEWETIADGTNVAVRKHARALADTGLPVLLKSFSNVVVTDGVAEPVHTVGIHPEIKKQVADICNTSVATTMPMIKHLVVRDAEHLRNVLVPRGVVHHDPAKLVEMRNAVLSATIVYSVWERDRIHPQVARWLGRVAECWVPCEQNKELLESAGLTRVVVVPHPFDPKNDICKLLRRKPRPGKRFYSIGRWEPRKGYHELVGAFLKAFSPGEATLTIKTSAYSWDGYPSPEETVGIWLAQNRDLQTKWKSGVRDIRILQGSIPQDKILKLHFDHNIYVASSHGEAWCLPAYDAKLAGNRLVHVPYGGTADFCGPGDVEVPWRFGPVVKSYNWEPDAQWAAYDVDDLARALKTVEAPERFEIPPGFERFTMQSVGWLMASRVLDVAARCGSKAAAYLASHWQEG